MYINYYSFGGGTMPLTEMKSDECTLDKIIWYFNLKDRTA